MNWNDTQPIDPTTSYQQIKNLLNQYQKIIEQKLYSNEDLLLQQLEQKTLKLKQTIASYKKQTAPENIQKLINEKRHEKQSQRIQLEIQWRNLTQRYKKLQSDQKVLNQKNKQSLYDIQNIQKKIAQLKQANQSLSSRVQNLKNQVQNRHFMTEIKPSYSSPYKFRPSTNQSLTGSRTSKLKLSTASDFRLKLQTKKRTIFYDKENHMKKSDSSRFDCFDLNTSFSNLINKSKFAPFHQPSLQNTNIEMKNYYTFPQKKNKPTEPSSALNSGKKYQQLIYYLDKPQVRQRIFQLLTKDQNVQL